MTPPLLDTIVAPATPLGKSALAIVRLDGPRAPEILAKLVSRDIGVRLAEHVRLVHQGETLDDCVVIVYRAPQSFTGNDLVELNLHGSPYLVERVIRACVAEGARHAEPGEFTERAVLNGKLDLVQAEAVFNLIESRTALQARLSLDQLDGALSEQAMSVRESLLHVISRFEAALDFAEEGYEFIDRGEVLRRLASATAAVEGLLATYERGRAITSGITAVILGRPNAGKSTLLNFLCGSERAIVTDIPGTTRDLLRETITLGGLPVTIVDTAGIRETSDMVEGIGVERARDAARRADLVLYLIDAAVGRTSADDAELDGHPDARVIYTKTDQAAAPAGASGVSVASGRGMDEFLAMLDAEVRRRFSLPEHSAVVVNERQREALIETREGLAAAAESIGNRFTEEVVLVDLYRAAGALGRLTGVITHGEVMGEIFGKFCIGK